MQRRMMNYSVQPLDDCDEALALATPWTPLPIAAIRPLKQSFKPVCHPLITYIHISYLL
jgi:hypothetical protein